MKTRLVSYRDGRIDLAFPLQDKHVTIGREADNLIQLPHDKISKHHGIIHQTKEGWVIEDLRSTNGILINGKQVERALLKESEIRALLGHVSSLGALDFGTGDAESILADMAAEERRIYERAVEREGQLFDLEGVVEKLRDAAVRLERAADSLARR